MILLVSGRHHIFSRFLRYALAPRPAPPGQLPFFVTFSGRVNAESNTLDLGHFCLVASCACNELKVRIKRSKLAQRHLSNSFRSKTTDSVGNSDYRRRKAMAKRLRGCRPSPRAISMYRVRIDRKKISSRVFRGTGKRRKPLLFIGHLDVVEALRAELDHRSLRFIEKGRLFHGRGHGRH